MGRRLRNFSCALGLILAFAPGCGRKSDVPPPTLRLTTKKSPEDARKALAQLGKPFSAYEFREAAEAGDRLAVELYLDAGMAPNGNGGYTPLMGAASKGQVECLKVLIGAGANVNAGDDANITALNYSTAHAQLESVQILLKAGADANIQPNKGGMGTTPLMSAAAHGDTNIVNALLKAGAKLELVSTEGMTAFDYAFDRAKGSVVLLLKGAGAKEFTTHHVMKVGSIYAEKVSKCAFAERDDFYNGTLKPRVFGATEKLVAQQIEDLTAGHYPSSVVCSILVQIVEAVGGVRQTASLLYESNPGTPELVKALDAIMDDCFASFQELYLISIKTDAANLRWTGSNGESALTLAVLMNRPDFVRQLIKAGVDVDGRNLKGRTAMDLAKENNRVEIAKLLVDSVR